MTIDDISFLERYNKKKTNKSIGEISKYINKILSQCLFLIPLLRTATTAPSTSGNKNKVVSHN